MHIRVAADILATENPYKETHLRAIRAIPPPFAKGHRDVDAVDRCWTDSPFLLPRQEGEKRKIEDDHRRVGRFLDHVRDSQCLGF